MYDAVKCYKVKWLSTKLELDIFGLEVKLLETNELWTYKNVAHVSCLFICLERRLLMPACWYRLGFARHMSGVGGWLKSQKGSNKKIKHQKNHLVWLFSFAVTSPVQDDSPQTGFWKGFGKVFKESETFLAHLCSLRTFKRQYPFLQSTTVVNDVVRITFTARSSC